MMERASFPQPDYVFSDERRHHQQTEHHSGDHHKRSMIILIVGKERRRCCHVDNRVGLGMRPLRSLNQETG